MANRLKGEGKIKNLKEMSTRDEKVEEPRRHEKDEDSDVPFFFLYISVSISPDDYEPDMMELKMGFITLTRPPVKREKN